MKYNKQSRYSTFTTEGYKWTDVWLGLLVKIHKGCVNNKKDRPNYLKYQSALFIPKNPVRLESSRVAKELEREGGHSRSDSRFIELHKGVKYNNSFKEWELRGKSKYNS